MNRQTLLVNLTLTVGIIALAVLILEPKSEDGPEPFVASNPSKDEDKTALDTAYNPELAKKVYPNFGTTKLFQALIPPTPSPTPTPPPPDPTPDVHAALKGWNLMGISSGVVTIENKDEKDPEKQFFDVGKNGVTLTIKDFKGVDVKRKLRIKKLSEYAENPFVIFELEGSGEEHVLKQFPDETK